jgi:enoyl-CoA hydratase/carnithine racemase
MDVVDAYNYASEIMLKNMMTHDAEEGISAFVEKRTPVWEDR